MTVQMATTSAARWAALSGGDALASLPPAARTFLVVAIGSPDEEALWGVVERVGVASGTVEVLDVEDSETSEGRFILADALRRARVGWHFVLVGSAVGVATARAALLVAGVLDAEISIVVTATTTGPTTGSFTSAVPRRIFCSHCHVIAVATVGIGGELDCAGCGEHLVVYYHFSRRLGAYMAFSATAEE